MSYLTRLALLCLVFSLGCTENASTQPEKRRAPEAAICVGGVRLMFLADTHLGQSSHVGDATAAVAYAAGLSPAPEAAYVVGDLTVGGHLGADSLAFLSWAVAQPLPVFPVAGNHDTGQYASSAEPLYQGGTDPYRLLRDSWPGLWEPEGPWYYQDHGSHGRVYALASCSDTTVQLASGLWVQAYGNCTYPGYSLAYWQARGYPDGNPDGTNPDTYGWMDTLSVQGTWLRDTLPQGPGWQIACTHRASYAAYQEASLRPLNRGARHGMLRPIGRYCAAVVQGDIHVPSVVVAPPDGTIYVSLQTGFVRRPLDLSHPGVVWPKTGHGERMDGTFWMLADICSSEMTLTLYQTFEEVTAAVWDTTLTR